MMLRWVGGREDVTLPSGADGICGPKVLEGTRLRKSAVAAEKGQPRTWEAKGGFKIKE